MAFRHACARFLLLFAAALIPALSSAQQAAAPDNYRLAAGDSIRVTVFQSPDMTLETRVSEDGNVNYPLLGQVRIGGLDIGSAEQKIAKGLKDGGFLKSPQVNIQVLEVRGNKISVLGQVNKPGSFPLQTTNQRLSQALADAGGLTPVGDDRVIVTGTRNNAPYRQEIDVDALYRDQRPDQDVVLAGGDTVYVPRAPTFYIYGEVTKPGNYRVDRGMTMRQAIATGGGLTPRGTENRLKVVRKTANGATERLSVGLDEPVRPDDVVYVTESWF